MIPSLAIPTEAVARGATAEWRDLLFARMPITSNQT